MQTPKTHLGNSKIRSLKSALLGKMHALLQDVLPKKQLEYLLYTGVRRFSILGRGMGGEGGEANLGIGRFIGGQEGGTMHFKIIGRGLAPDTPPRPFQRLCFIVVSANKCHIHMCTIFFNVYVDHFSRSVT